MRPDMQSIIHMPIARHVIVEECFTQQNDFMSFLVFLIYSLFVDPLLLPVWGVARIMAFGPTAQIPYFGHGGLSKTMIFILYLSVLYFFYTFFILFYTFLYFT